MLNYQRVYWLLAQSMTWESPLANHYDIVRDVWFLTLLRGVIM